MPGSKTTPESVGRSARRAPDRIAFRWVNGVLASGGQRFRGSMAGSRCSPADASPTSLRTACVARPGPMWAATPSSCSGLSPWYSLPVSWRTHQALVAAHLRRHLAATCYTEGFSHFVTSMTAPVASGWSGCRVGLAPTGKRRLVTAHTLSGHC